jgi:hypothetical protein
MFDGSLPEIDELTALDDAGLVDAAAGWARTENAACARKLAVMAELFARRTGLPAGERELWWVDPDAAVGAELGATQHISTWMALAQAHRGVVLADRLPMVAALFAAGLISELLVRAIEYRTALVTDPDAVAHLDALVAEQVTAWGPLSARKIEHAIDALVDQVDPGALRRSRKALCQRDVQFGSPTDEAGFTSLWARLYAPDAVALQQRVEEMARGVCEDDPRTLGERRADALTALAAGIQLMACHCAHSQCPAARREVCSPASAVIHVVAHADTGANTLRPDPGAAADSEAFCPAPAAFVIGGGVLPGPLLAAIAERATVRELRHPGDAQPEPRYTPSRALADFVRCRDLTCRFPGCDRPATQCDLDHTVPYPVGPSHASNIKCLCRFHHMLKTFWCGIGGWHDRQLSDGTVIWTSPTGHTYTTKPGSALLFPTLSLPTGELELPTSDTTVAGGDRGVMMPKRRRTRADNLQRRFDAERRLNDDYVAERAKPPPF